MPRLQLPLLFGLIPITTLGCAPVQEKRLPPVDAIDAGTATFSWPDLPTCAAGYEAAPRTLGRLPGRELEEVSGLVASKRTPGVLWGHNDSGDSARIFAITTEGNKRVELSFVGASFDDAEDIAISRCPSLVSAVPAPCLWVADIGDNAARRAEVSLFVTPEPSLQGVTDGTRLLDDRWVRMRFRYADGAMNAEALVATPEGDALYIFEKSSGQQSRIYRLAVVLDDNLQVAERVGTLASPGFSPEGGGLITGADLHPSGARLAIRTYGGLFEYQIPDWATPADVGGIEPLTISTRLAEPQGESVAYDETGLGLVTASESVDGTGQQPLHQVGCVL